MFEILIAAALGAERGNFAAPECMVAFEQRVETRLILRLRPACQIGYASTQGAVRAILAEAGEARELSLAMGRIERYPWLSSLLARQASSSRRWQIADIAVEKVLVKAAADLPLPAGAPIPQDSKLPYDAILWITLKRP